MSIQVSDRVSYTDNHGDRQGTVIETNYDEEVVKNGTYPKRVRVKWDDKRPRTWIRVSALTKLQKDQAGM